MDSCIPFIHNTQQKWLLTLLSYSLGLTNMTLNFFKFGTVKQFYSPAVSFFLLYPKFEWPVHGTSSLCELSYFKPCQLIVPVKIERDVSQFYSRFILCPEVKTCQHMGSRSWWLKVMCVYHPITLWESSGMLVNFKEMNVNLLYSHFIAA